MSQHIQDKEPRRTPGSQGGLASPCQKMHKLFLLAQDSAGGSERLQSRGRPKPAPSQRSFRHHVRRPPRLGVTTENRSLPLRGDEGYPVLLLCPFQPAHRNSRGPTTLGLPPPISFTQAPAEVPTNGGLSHGRASGLQGGVDTTEGHGETGRGFVGRWRAVPAA